MLKGELVVLNIADIALAEGARLIVHGVLNLLQLIEGSKGDARQLEDARGVLGPKGGQLAALSSVDRPGVVFLLRLMQSRLRGAPCGTREVGVGGGVCL